MSVREENENSHECTCGSPISAGTGRFQSSIAAGHLAESPPPGDPNPKGYRTSARGIITNLPVTLESGTATFTVEETFTGDDKDALSSFTFTLTCETPEVASILIPPGDHRKWTTPDGKPLHPGDTSPSVLLKDPSKQKLNKNVPVISLDVQLKLHQKGTTQVSFNADVTGENQPISKGDSKTLDVKVI
jgi:hypothetical protein